MLEEATPLYAIVQHLSKSVAMPRLSNCCPENFRNKETVVDKVEEMERGTHLDPCTRRHRTVNPSIADFRKKNQFLVTPCLLTYENIDKKNYNSDLLPPESRHNGG